MMNSSYKIQSDQVKMSEEDLQKMFKTFFASIAAGRTVKELTKEALTHGKTIIKERPGAAWISLWCDGVEMAEGYSAPAEVNNMDQLVENMTEIFTCIARVPIAGGRFVFTYKNTLDEVKLFVWTVVSSLASLEIWDTTINEDGTIDFVENTEANKEDTELENFATKFGTFICLLSKSKASMLSVKPTVDDDVKLPIKLMKSFGHDIKINFKEIL